MMMVTTVMRTASSPTKAGLSVGRGFVVLWVLRPELLGRSRQREAPQSWIAGYARVFRSRCCSGRCHHRRKNQLVAQSFGPRSSFGGAMRADSVLELGC